MSTTQYAFGIDLGTTNSCIAVRTALQPAQVIPLADGEKTLPSCVMYKNGEVIVGRRAYDHRADVDHVVYSSKRDIGSDKTYTVYANGDDKPPVQVTPVDVACEILKRLKHDAELLYGDGFIKDVTITVPAYFTLERRAATLEAAKRAGLNVISLINEPTAAALAYGGGTPEGEKILIYDLGGGTFDATLLNMVDKTDCQTSKSDSNDIMSDLFGDVEQSEESKHSATVIASAGNPRLGGDDIDEEVYRLAVRDLNSSLAGDIDVDTLISNETREEVILHIEHCKKTGSFTTLNCPLIVTFPGEDKARTVDLHITHEHFSKAFRKVSTDTQHIVNECLVGQNLDDIHKIILIGGSTKLQYIRDVINKEYGFSSRVISTELNPDEAVALGAAVNSAILIGNIKMTITDVLQQSIGIECVSKVGDQLFNGRFTKILMKNAPLPASATFALETSEPMQEIATVPIFQGEDAIAANNTPIGIISAKLNPTEDTQSALITLTVTPSGVLKAVLTSNADKVHIELENVLRPAANKTGANRMLNKYKALIERYVQNKELYKECKQTLAELEHGNITFSVFKKRIDTLTAADRKAVVEDIAKKSVVTKFAENTSEFEEDSEDSD